MIAEQTTHMIKRYLNGHIAVKVILGVQGSPSCEVSNPGMLVEELQSALKRNDISVPFLEASYEMTDDLQTRLKKIVNS